MAKYSYSTVPAKIPELLQKTQSVGIPQSVNLEWLQSIGFVGSNDRTLLPVLKFVGFIDSTGKPTEAWRRYRNRDVGSRILAQMLQDSYNRLFQLYSDAHLRSEEELANFFTAETSSGVQAISKTVATFKTLCSLADFSDGPTKTESEEAIDSSDEGRPSTREPNARAATKVKVSPPELGGNVTINLNIQLTLPSEMDQAGYGEFFAALRKHLVEPYKDTGEQ